MHGGIKAKRHEVAHGVANLLIAAENGIDDAIGLAAALSGGLPAARKSAMLAAEVGNDAFIHTAEALRQLISARSAIVQAHQNLAEIVVMMGLDPTAFGGAYGKPKATILTVVEDQAA